MHRFYAPDIASENVLPEDESRHALRVLRLPVGERIEVVDGAGNIYYCTIADTDYKHCALNVIDIIPQPPHWGCNISIAIAPTKNIERIEWMLEKCTEIGINKVIPLKCRYSERKEIKRERLEKILVSAMKQSLKASVPELCDIMPIEKFLTMPISGLKYIAYCGDDVVRKDFAQEYVPGSDVTILIGPEGDFSPQEVDVAFNNGFVPVSLGNSRLRTETAAVFSCMAIHAINQRLL